MHDRFRRLLLCPSMKKKCGQFAVIYVTMLQISCNFIYVSSTSIFSAKMYLAEGKRNLFFCKPGINVFPLGALEYSVISINTPTGVPTSQHKLVSAPPTVSK